MDNDGPYARHQHSHQDAEYHRVELITGGRRRRDQTAEDKVAILAASIAPGSTVAEAARRFEVNRRLLWTWRRKAMDELEVELPRFDGHF